MTGRAKHAPDVSVVVNAHREGRLLEATMTSATAAVDYAAKGGIASEVICVLDRGDADTREVAASFGPAVRVIETDFGDLASARNAGANAAGGEFTTFLDGDDLWGFAWIANCVALLRADAGASPLVAHPMRNIYFGRGRTPYVWTHPDMRSEAIGIENLLVSNPWTALSFASTSLYRSYPYRPNGVADGFGYEDWLWHFETIQAGVLHVTVDETVHFVRRKQSGSLLQTTNASDCLPRLFGSTRGERRTEAVPADARQS